ncbi:DUF4347 domain-containing protein [Lyngbya aestuarii]|uniref:DUF4347 domain-containing protein n=1 Tax=Lyngbya aestuarii TaxID=118322 RepID=UPI00403E018C
MRNSSLAHNNSITLEPPLHQNAHPHADGEILVVIDPRVDNYQMLSVGVNPGAKVLILNPSRDGIEQITKAIATEAASSLHIVCHGAPGLLYLGKTPLNLANIEQYRQQLLEWGVADILLYACNVAAGDNVLFPTSFIPYQFTSFLHRLHELTGANIAASAGRIGNSTQGGSWHLESQIGEIASGLAFSPEIMQAYPGILAKPTDISLSNTFVEGNLPFGIPIGSFSTTDADIGDTHTYSLAFGEVYTDNHFFAIDGSSLTIKEPFLENKDSYNIMVLTHDQAGEFFWEPLTINVSQEVGDTIETALSTQLSPVNPAPFTFTGTITDHQNIALAPESDIDIFSLQLNAGDLMTIDIDASEFGSSLDAALRVLDWQGNELAQSSNNPAPGEDLILFQPEQNSMSLNLDPYIEFTALETGTYYVEVKGENNLALANYSSGSSTGEYNLEIELLDKPIDPMVPLGASGAAIMVDPILG